MRILIFAALGAAVLALTPVASAQQTRSCDIPNEARDIWHCESGFVIGPEDVIIRLPIPETDPEALYNAGVEAAEREDWRVAIAYFTAAQQRAHLVPRYMYNLGLAHARAGHEVAAIAWLAAYLVAAPDAPNRTAVWEQIHQLETTAQANIDVLWRRAGEAADALPVRGDQTNLGPQFFGRDAARMALAEARTRAQEPPPFVNSSLLPATGITPTFANRLMWEETGRSGGRFLEAAHRGGQAALIQSARESSFQPSEYVALAQRSAALGNVQEAFNNITASDPQALDRGLGFLGDVVWQPARESIRADVAEIFLIAGDAASAARAAEMAREVIVPGVGGGWPAARVEAFLLAERGEFEAAVQSLQIFYSRHYGEQNVQWGWGWGWSGGDENWQSVWPFEPGSRWNQARFDAVGSVVEYLVWRGRVDDALHLASQLDTLRAVQLVAYLRRRIEAGSTSVNADALAQFESETVRRASGGTAIEPARREDVERQIMAALNQSGAAYDLDWWLRWIDRRHIQYDILASNPGEPAAQVKALIRTPESLSRGLGRVRAAYQYARVGGGWGSTTDNHSPDPGSARSESMAACPSNIANASLTSPLTCACPPLSSLSVVWGSGAAYTADSHICTAAVHAGVITQQAGGRIVVTPSPGLSAYLGSTRNGVTTYSYGSYGHSYTIRAAGQ